MSKNILIIISSLWWGWAERVATTIWSHLNKNNKVFYLTRYNNEKEYDFSRKKICIGDKLSTSYIVGIYRIIKRSFIIKKISKKYNIDYCISFMEESSFPNILSKYILHNRSKIILSIRDSIDSKSIVYRTFVKLFYNNADLIVPNSKEERENIIENYWVKPEKVKVFTIYNPLNFETINNLKNEDIKEKLFNRDIFSFITVWRVVEQKNQRFLIKCFNKFSLEYPNAQLIIVGEWPLKNELMELPKNRNVIFLWHQKNVYKWLYHSDCFLFSSLHEWFPNAVLEAMACWLPILSTPFKTWIKENVNSGK